MRRFDFYEFVGYIAPGTILLLGLSLLFPSVGTFVNAQATSLGDFGIFLVLAYVAGHLIQAVGNMLETIWWWLWSGRPTDRIRESKASFLSQKQYELILSRIQSQLDYSEIGKLSDIDSKEWPAIVKQIYSIVRENGQSEKTDIFNGNYGLNRGLASTFIFLSIATPLLSECVIWKTEALLLLAFAISIFRMHRFGKRYAQELFIQFLSGK